jgi:lipoprotein-releasing system permease protein
MTMIILVAAFNIIGTLVLVVTEKQREIAILKAIGAGNRSISKIFMYTGCIIGAVGTAIGLILAYLLIILLRDYIHFPLNSNVYQVEKLPAVINPSDFFMVAVAALLISFLATLYPSLKASRLEPVEGLRYE